MDNKGVGAVIGIILMFAITVAIAGTVYIYIDGVLKEPKTENIFVYGNVTKIEKIYGDGGIDYRITFDYNNTYLIGNENFDWEIGQYYNMSLWRSEYLNKWLIKEYILLVEEIN